MEEGLIVWEKTPVGRHFGGIVSLEEKCSVGKFLEESVAGEIVWRKMSDYEYVYVVCMYNM